MAASAEPQEVEPVKVLVLWTNISGYMCENWRQLAAQPDLRVKAIACRSDITRDNASFGPDVIEALDIALVNPCDPELPRLVSRRIRDDRPDVLFVAGWSTPAYRRAIQTFQNHCPLVIMAMDTPWRGRPRQYLARFALGGYLKHVDAVLTAGNRSRRYALRLGFQPERIFNGLYSWDSHLRTKCLEITSPKQGGFLFVGRYVAEKGLVTLVNAYAKYRAMVAVPWGLTCCGAGPLQSLLRGQPGIQDAGFVAPRDLPMHFAQARIFVLPSYFEPWGVAVAEAMGCGLPAIVSDACGAGDDLIESGVSGFVVPAGSADALATQMVECHLQADKLNEVAALASRSASRFTSMEWATRFRAMLKNLLPDSRL